MSISRGSDHVTCCIMSRMLQNVQVGIEQRELQLSVNLIPIVSPLRVAVIVIKLFELMKRIISVVRSYFKFNEEVLDREWFEF